MLRAVVNAAVSRLRHESSYDSTTGALVLTRLDELQTVISGFLCQWGFGGSHSGSYDGWGHV